MRPIGILTAIAAMIAAAPLARAHHSFAMFDNDNPITIEGAVKEFKFTSPHTFIVLVVAGKNGDNTTWTLEGVSPAELVREGWSSKTLKTGDDLKIKIAPFRSGIPGGSWRAPDVSKGDGTPFVVTH